MDIARFSINRPIYTWIIILGCLLGGIWGFLSLGRLEDPSFTIKTAVVITTYPGASAEEVADEISEPLESELQKMGEVDEIRTTNQPGLSQIFVDIQDQYDGSELPAIWVKLRNRVSEAPLPTGASVPFVNDTFGDVYGLFYAVTAPGFSDAELHDLSSFLRREVLSVDGVADISVAGLPDEAIFVEPDLALTTTLGVPPSAIQSALANADEIVEGGTVLDGGARTLVQRPDGSDSISEIANLTVGVGGEVIKIRDFAEVFRAREAVPRLIIRHDGQEAFTFGVAGISTENIVTVGERVDVKLDELRRELPVGITIAPVYQQHIVVDDSVNDFLVNLATSVSIVIAVLAVFMGWRAAVVVGLTLLLTVVGSLFFMNLFSVEMERISLGALIIAMGMLVDNAIVVAEGMQIAMLRGKSSRDAATESAKKAQIPLLGATVIGIMAFASIGLSPDSTGEFMFSLFAVIGISLLLSWVLAVTATPLLGHYFFERGKEGDTDQYDGAFFRAYGSVLRVALKFRWIVIVALFGITAACFVLFGQIRQQFFPDSSTPLYFVHYKLPQSSSIFQTSEDLKILEEWLATRENVVAVTSFAGDGAERFMLTYDSEDPNQSYGHAMVRVTSLEVMEEEMAAAEAFAETALPDGQFRVKRLAFGPSVDAPIQVRFYGEDGDVLRDLADEAMETMAAATPNALALRMDWGEKELVLKPVYSDDRAQEAGISRSEVTQSLEFATVGLQSGTYREGDRQIPLIVRTPQDQPIALTDHVLYSSSGEEFVPFEQVIDGMVFEPQDTVIYRRDRENVITVGADIPRSMTAAEVLVELRSEVEAIEVPEGYRMVWGGEFESSTDAQSSLGSQLPMAALVMLLITILLFNGLRQTAIIWLLVPMSVNGAAIGLVGTGLPFTFTALLGLLSLSGMLIKNGIVLVEEIDLHREEFPDDNLVDAITVASTSRLRPVVLAGATTILGMIPLLSDAFFQSMSVTIMGGLAFASVLTLIAAPVFYLVFFSGADRRAKAARKPAEMALAS
ncbi:MAG: efflux RND transporter permease subunit [Pseudomonadota bacterium]